MHALRSKKLRPEDLLHMNGFSKGMLKLLVFCPNETSSLSFFELIWNNSSPYVNLQFMLLHVFIFFIFLKRTKVQHIKVVLLYRVLDDNNMLSNRREKRVSV
uniref:Uncharacterized protein n=1 Tax=Opuntia streptacantha TaxID=393608 RepID=A0A7C9CU98_OPUST